MAYPAAAIANEFLELAKWKHAQLTQMQVQKLVFFSHGWNLALRDEPLISELFQAWEYGPVVRSLYSDLRQYGSGPVTDPVREYEWNGGKFSYTVPSIGDGSNSEENVFTKALIARVWETYGHLQGFQLSEITHLSDAPWSQARENGDQFIPNDLIRDYFSGLKGKEDGRAEALEAV